MAACFCILLPVFSHAKSIALVYNEEQAVFVQFAEALAGPLAAQGHTLTPIHLTDYLPATSDPKQSFDLTLIAGNEALQVVRAMPPNTPMWATLVSREAYQQSLQALQRGHPHVSAIYHDPPPFRQLALAQRLQPGIRQVGYLYGPAHADEAQMLVQAAEKLGLTVVAMPVSTTADLPATLISVLQRSDVLLANADPQIYNSQTIKTILTAAYRQDKTLIGSSPAFVKAGSLATTYTPIHQIVEEVLSFTSRWQNGHPVQLPLAHYPSDFEVLVKTDVAHSLGLNTPGVEELKRQIQHTEQQNRFNAGALP